jgi:hypothetical protein
MVPDDQPDLQARLIAERDRYAARNNTCTGFSQV